MYRHTQNIREGVYVLYVFVCVLGSKANSLVPCTAVLFVHAVILLSAIHGLPTYM